MSDLEITRLCAEAMGFRFRGKVPNPECYDPLNDDGQAMKLVKRFNITCIYGSGSWLASSDESHDDADLNRAICECVAKMQKKQKYVNT